MRTFDDIKTMSDEELREENVKMTKILAKRFATGVVLSVGIHFASNLVINMIEKKNEEADTTEED